MKDDRGVLPLLIRAIRLLKVPGKQGPRRAGEALGIPGAMGLPDAEQLLRVQVAEAALRIDPASGQRLCQAEQVFRPTRVGGKVPSLHLVAEGGAAGADE